MISENFFFFPIHGLFFIVLASKEGVEEKIIRKKIDNILSQSYPLDKITIIIASDASTDKTHETVNSYHADNVRLIISPERRGKTHCENIALEHVQDEIIVFTDASTMLEKDCLRKLVRHFRFESIGCVSTRDRSVSSGVRVTNSSA